MNGKRYLASKYEILEKIGKGGMASVFKAKDIKNNEIVAIKILHPNIADDIEDRERFWREAKIGLTLNHPNIVRIIEYSEEKNIPYIVMEYLEGPNLKEYIKAKGKIFEPEAKDIAKQILSALIEAHRCGVIHRDLKPQNIKVQPNGVVKVLDFGLSKSLEYTTLTQTSSYMGTPQYMSPEQARGAKHVDIRSDLYSFGVILFEMLTGELPYDGDTPAVIGIKHLTEPIPTKKLEENNLSSSMRALIQKAMSKNPESRYQTPEEILMDIEYGTIKSEEQDYIPTISRDNANELSNRGLINTYSYEFSQKSGSVVTARAEAEFSPKKPIVPTKNAYKHYKLKIALTILFAMAILTIGTIASFHLVKSGKFVNKAQNLNKIESTKQTSKEILASINQILQNAEKEIANSKSLIGNDALRIYNEAIQLLASAKIAFQNKNYFQAKSLSEQVLMRIQEAKKASLEYERKLEKMKFENEKKEIGILLNSMRTLLANVEQAYIQFSSEYGDELSQNYQALKLQINKAESYFQKEDLSSAKKVLIKFKESANEFQATIENRKIFYTKKKEAESAIKKAEDAIEQANLEDAADFAPSSIEKAKNYLSEAKALLNMNEFDDSKLKAENAASAAANAKQEAVEGKKTAAKNEIQKAEDVINQAQSENAEEYASSLLDEAKNYFNEAKKLFDSNEYKESMANARNAIESAERAKEKARKTAERIAAEREEKERQELLRQQRIANCENQCSNLFNICQSNCNLTCESKCYGCDGFWKCFACSSACNATCALACKSNYSDCKKNCR